MSTVTALDTRRTTGTIALPDHFEAGIPTRTDLELRPLSGHLGAEVQGVDLGAHLTAADVAAIRTALVKWKVLFVSGQQLDHPQLVAFASRLGRLTTPHRRPEPQEGFPTFLTADGRLTQEEFERLEARRDLFDWRADATAALAPPAISVLLSSGADRQGGTVTWTNLTAAYQSLSRPIRTLVDGLRAIHDVTPPERSGPRGRLTIADPTAVASEHPLARVHPDTRERALFLSAAFVTHLSGLTQGETRWLLDLLHGQIAAQPHTIRFRLKPGTVALWDHHTTAPLTPRDLSHEQRRYQLVNLAGSLPVGADGATSRAWGGPRSLAE